ncbi:MAG TPA: GNAT family protein, partial [Pseudomonadales bacterium]|nr:GNAT family protein [Pseudomonadales bacterium]
ALFTLNVDQEIILRTIHPDGAAALFALMEKNRARLRPWIDPSALPETAAATRKYAIECYFNWIGSDEAFGTDYFAELDGFFPPYPAPLEMCIRFRDELVGVITLSRLSDSVTAAEFGYWISAEKEGQGIITRCVSALMDYAIDHMGIQRFVIGCAVDNLRSRRVPERLGYRKHVIIPKGEVVGEFVYDRIIYGIRSSEWQKNKHLLNISENSNSTQPDTDSDS